MGRGRSKLGGNNGGDVTSAKQKMEKSYMNRVKKATSISQLIIKSVPGIH